MTSTRCWQVRASYRGGRVIMFGVQASGEPQAILKALRQLAEIPGTADRLTVSRLYGRYHPLRAAARAPLQTRVDKDE